MRGRGCDVRRWDDGDVLREGEVYCKKEGRMAVESNHQRQLGH